MGRKTSRRHALGQHFLHNPRVLDRIIRVIAPEKQDSIVEIGAGQGALTFRLARAAGRVIAVERDPSLIPELENQGYANLVIKQADILKIRLSDLIGDGQTKLVGNLPYSVSSPILFKVLRERKNVLECHFLVQKEFAARLTSRPESRSYAPLTILIQNAFHVTTDFFVAPGSFRPPPRVDSAFISLFKRDRPQIVLADEEAFRRFLFTAFSQRRKKLINNLKSLRSAGIDPEKGLQASGIDGDLRPEAVSIPDFGRLFLALFPAAGPSSRPKGK